jgi:glycosyltransferase involved in cell wall biosynthesis
VLVYQLATASAMASWLLRRPEPLVVNYHNVTPPSAFARWDNALALHQSLAQLEVALLAPRARLGVAVSEYNRADLAAAGYAETAVVPPVVQLADGPEPSGADGHPAERAGASHWLAVGRLAPNKAVEDVVAGLFAYRATVDPEAHLSVVGRPAVPGYARALQRFVAELGLRHAVAFIGRVDDRGLGRLYRSADLLVVASRHEGFCLPVVEAMAHDLPVVARRQGAVPEVAGDAAVLLDSMGPAEVAGAAARLASDLAERSAQVARGRERVAALDLDTAAERMVDLLAAVAAG